MFHLPAIPFAEIEQYLVGFAVLAATCISVYEFVRFKLDNSGNRSKPKGHRKRF
jgi:hypothetical protein